MASRGGMRLAGVVAAICAALIAGVPAALAQRQLLFGHVPAAAANLQAVGALPETNRMNLVIGLPLRNKPALTNLLNDLYNPASPNFHQCLTPEQFTERFGPTAEDYQGVKDFALSHGLRVTGTHPNRTLLDVNGTVADIQEALHLHLRVYEHPVEGRLFFAPDVEPSPDLAVPVLHIGGLDNYIIPHKLLVRANGGKSQKPQLGSGPDETYMGYDFRDAYVPGAWLTGAGQSVGLYEGDGYDYGDITNYEAQAHLPNVPLVNVLIDTATGAAGSAADEVSLDIEMAVSMAPGLASAIVYEGEGLNNLTDPYNILIRMATDNQAKQLSCSWGFNIDSNIDQIFQQFQAQKQSFYLASGDSGAYTGAVSPPADDPNITVVGATTLSTSGALGTWESETVWNWFTTGQGDLASSGGSSTTVLIPSWQAPVNMTNNQGSKIYRNLPDVAMVGDNIWVIYGGNQTGDYGGTSCAAPLWAGFTALVNQQRTNNELAPVGFVNPAIYSIGLGSNYGAAFHDVTSGNNTNATTQSEFFAVPGYDLCTGWATPTGTNLINLLAPLSPKPILNASATLVSESCLPTNGAIDPGETVTVSLSLLDVSGASTTNLVATMLPSASVLDPGSPQYYGVVAAGPGPAVSQTFTFTAEGTCGQPISAFWQLQDGTANLGTVSLNFTLGVLTPATTFSQNFDSVTPPALPAGWSNVVTGSQVNWVTTSSAADTPPNSVFATDVPNIGLAYLTSPAMTVLATNAQVTFRQNYNLEAVTNVSRRHGTTTTYYDGGVLEIALGAGGFADILSAGGSFVTGGYNGALYGQSGNPLGGRLAWGGSSGGWITTTVNLPAAAAGRSIQLRWGCATDNVNLDGGIGWYVDTIFLHDWIYACCDDNADVLVSETAAPSPFVLGQAGTYTLTVSNAGPDLAADVVVTDALPAGATFISASPGCVFSNGNVICTAGTLAAGAAEAFSVNVLPGESGFVTNVVSAASITADLNPANNLADLVTVVRVLVAPSVDASSIVVSGGRISISLQSVAGLNYMLQYKDDLSEPSWTTLPKSGMTGTGGVIVLQDDTAVSERFYQVACN